MTRRFNHHLLGERLGLLWSRLLRGEAGVVAPVVAVGLTAMLGLVAAGVDLGRLYAAKAELQNAADAAALSGAATLLNVDASGNAITQCQTAVDTAKALSLQNQALGVNLDLLDQDITMGLWDQDTGDFDPNKIGPTTNPDDLNAFRVLVRRDQTANAPVTTMFARVLGIDNVEITATSTAFLGYVGEVGEGEVDLPIAVMEDAVSGEGGAECGKELVFASENDENAEWTTFFVWPSNSPSVEKFVDGTWPIPALSVGDEINVINGKLSTGVFDALEDRFQSEGSDTDGDGTVDSWRVLLPVVDEGHCSVQSTITGFATFVITEVNGPPAKNLVGTLLCGSFQPQSQSGGGDFGTRAAAPKLVQ